RDLQTPGFPSSLAGDEGQVVDVELEERVGRPGCSVRAFRVVDDDRPRHVARRGVAAAAAAVVASRTLVPPVPWLPTLFEGPPSPSLPSSSCPGCHHRPSRRNPHRLSLRAARDRCKCLHHIAGCRSRYCSRSTHIEPYPPCRWLSCRR